MDGWNVNGLNIDNRNLGTMRNSQDREHELEAPKILKEEKRGGVKRKFTILKLT